MSILSSDHALCFTFRCMCCSAFRVGFDWMCVFRHQYRKMIFNLLWLIMIFMIDVRINQLKIQWLKSRIIYRIFPCQIRRNLLQKYDEPSSFFSNAFLPFRNFSHLSIHYSTRNIHGLFVWLNRWNLLLYKWKKCLIHFDSFEIISVGNVDLFSMNIFSFV